MAIALYFESIIARKSAIQSHFPGGVLAFHELLSDHGPIGYAGDENLIAVYSMGGSRVTVLDPLLATGLRVSPTDATADITYVDMLRGALDCPWLSSRHLHDGLVVWLSSDDPGFVRGPTFHAFRRRVSDAVCGQCQSSIGIVAAAMAIDAKERLDGPLAHAGVNDGLRNRLPDKYVVQCSRCDLELEFGRDGRPLTPVHREQRD